ncbi:MAG: 5-(carboxyamino)imidazole ribonucleotide mutase [Elusimicrobia bacterium]|nr:5-(carboxyamino)imidazole ribonucleotide mutase [Elusimicrobiota bacterium]
MKTARTARRPSAKVAVIMGSASDWETMRHACGILAELGIPHEKRVISAHRTPDLLTSFMASAESRGIRVVIAGAGGAAHLAGVAASRTLLPVLGVPIQTKALQGLDSLLSIVQMPKGIPVGTLGIGEGGAANAALLAAQVLALGDAALKRRLAAFREAQARKVREASLP